MRNVICRFMAIGFLSYVAGVVIATKGLEPQLEFKILLWSEKAIVFFSYAGTMFFGYIAGRESKEGRR